MSVNQVSAIDPHQRMHGSEGNMKAQILWSPKTENVVSRPAALLSPGNMLEMQNWRPHSRPTESESTFNKISNLCICTLRLEKHCFSFLLPAQALCHDSIHNLGSHIYYLLSELLFPPPLTSNGTLFFS